MALNRRGLFAALAGGLVAGPAIVREGWTCTCADGAWVEPPIEFLSAPDLRPGAIMFVQVTNPGSGYTSPPIALTRPPA